MRKSGELPFYDAAGRVKQPCSALILLSVTLFFAFVAASFGRYDFFKALPLAAYPLYLTVLAGISVRRMFRKLLPLSFFVFFIGAWNIFHDKSVITVYGFALWGGWLSFGTIALKFLLSVSAVLAMFSLTGFDALCRTLASLGLPGILVNQLFLFYRYIGLITGETRNIVRARLFRGGNISVRQSGNICGPLILRCFARSRRIHDALGCRGYADVIYGGKSVRTRAGFSDKIFGVAWIIFFLAVRFDFASVVGGFVLRYGAS